MSSERNYLTKSEAKYLVGKIERYWKSRGYDGLKVWTEPMPIVLLDTGDDSSPQYVVIRSNIGPSGFPPRKATEIETQPQPQKANEDGPTVQERRDGSGTPATA